MPQLNKPAQPTGNKLLKAILLLVLVGIIGGTVWYIRNTQQAVDATDKAMVSAAQTSTTQIHSADIEHTKLSKVPTELQKAVYDYTAVHAMPCVKNGQIVDFNGNPVDNDVVFDAKGFAESVVGCDGGSATLFAQTGTGWQQIDSTQSAFSCTVLRRYKVAQSFLVAVQAGHLKPGECYENGKGVQYTE
jgi:hypothetical protein